MKKEWNQEELEAQVSETRTIKTLSKRKPDCLAYKRLTKKVAKAAGYKINAVTEVIDALVDIIRETVTEERKSVKLSDLCMFYPVVRKARQGTCLKGGTGNKIMIIPPRWELMFQASTCLAKTMKNLEVTEEDVENLYP